MSASLTERVIELCEDTLARLGPGEASTRIAAVAERLRMPLQVTVAGGVSSDKSTLVNALLGQSIAAVDAGECTKVVTWFRYDHHERIEVILRDGRIATLPLGSGGMPADLGAPADEIRRIVVYLSNAGLKQMNLIDTPGLNTVTRVNEENTAEFLGVDNGSVSASESSAAIGGADALVFLMPYLREADANVMAGFRRLYEGTGLSAFNAVGVLSRIDRLSPTGDPLTNAAPIAARVGADLRGVVSRVVPVIGLLAQTSRAAQFTEGDAAAVAVVAAVTDPLDREDLLLTVGDFLSSDLIDLPENRRRRLVDLLDLFGLRTAVEVVDAGGRGAAPILREIELRSGFEPLRHLLEDQFGKQADLMKASVGVGDLRRLSYLMTDAASAEVLAHLRTPLERIELDPDLHQLRVIEVMESVAAGFASFDDVLMADLERLCEGTSPLSRLGVQQLADAPAAAIAGAGRWAALSQDRRRPPHQQRLARIVKEAFETLWAQTSAAIGGPR